MNIQINGHRKSADTRKAERFFSERGIRVHMRDVIEKPLSRGELENITRSIAAEDLIDEESRTFKKRGLAHMVYDALEEIEEDPSLLRMPVVRNGNRATAGYAPETWSEWVAEEKRDS